MSKIFVALLVLVVLVTIAVFAYGYQTRSDAPLKLSYAPIIAPWNLIGQSNQFWLMDSNHPGLGCPKSIDESWVNPSFSGMTYTGAAFYLEVNDFKGKYYLLNCKMQKNGIEIGFNAYELWVAKEYKNLVFSNNVQIGVDPKSGSEFALPKTLKMSRSDWSIILLDESWNSYRGLVAFDAGWSVPVVLLPSGHTALMGDYYSVMNAIARTERVDSQFTIQNGAAIEDRQFAPYDIDLANLQFVSGNYDKFSDTLGVVITNIYCKHCSDYLRTGGDPEKIAAFANDFRLIVRTTKGTWISLKFARTNEQ